MADNLIFENQQDRNEHQTTEKFQDPQKSDKEPKYEQQKDQNEILPPPIPDPKLPVHRNGSFQEINSGEFFNSPKSTKGSVFGSNNNFQFHQIPVPYMSRRGSRARDNFALGNSSSYQQNRSHNTFLERFRSQTSIPETVANSSSSKGSTRNGSSRSVLTSPVDLIPPPSPCSTKSSIGGHSHNANFYANGHGPRPTKPKKWFSFTNLLNRQNLSSLLNLPKSRLSVSSTLNSVFVGPTSPSPSASESYTGNGNAFFGGGITNLGCERSPRHDSFNNHPISPTPSSATVLGECTYNNRYPFTNENVSGPGQVVFRSKSGSGRSGSANSNGGVVGPGGANSVQFSGNGNFSNTGKNYSSGGSSVCGNNSESTSERSSGVGYYTGYSSGSSTAGGSAFIGGGGSSGGGGSRLSCGEFFTGTPNSPICSGETHSEFQFQFNSGHSSSGFGSRDGETSSSSSSAATAAAFYNYHKTLGRSLPTLLESMETGNSSQGSSEGGSPHTTVDSVVDLMYQEFAILTGSKSIDDHYIMTFPDRGNFHLLTDEDYKRLMIYLTAVPPMHDAESGFVIIIDRRNDKWNSVKTTLIKISSYFPGLIHRVFVLRPVGFLQKALSEVSSKLFRTENLRFRLTVCNSICDLMSFVEPSQLTTDLGGYLHYDKVKWVQQRVEVEAFHLALQSLSRDLKSFTEMFQDFEYPNDVASTETLISEKHSEFLRLRGDLSQAGEHGESLLQRVKKSSSSQSLKEEKSSSSNGNGKAQRSGDANKPRSKTNRTSSSVQLINVISLERFIIQIEETTRLFEEFWTKEKISLDQCLRLRRFEQEFREMQATFDSNMKRLDDLGEMGESLGATDCLIAETLAFEISSTDDVSRAILLDRVGREIVETNQSAIDTVGPKCFELNRMSSEFRSRIQEKIKKQKKWREVQATIEKANQLCNEGMDLMTYQISESADDCTDNGSCVGSITSRIDDFLDKIRVMGEELTHLKTTLSSPTNSQSKPLVKQVLKRVEDVQMMCIKRKSLIAAQILKSKSRRSSGSSITSTSCTSTPSSTSQLTCSTELKSAKSTSQLDSNLEDYSTPCLKSGSSSLSLDGSGMMGQMLNRKEEDWEIRRIKRGHVLNELLQTERTYVEEIGEILTEYRDQLGNPEVRSLLPSQLQPIITPTKLQRRSPNIAVLFCNLDEIHAFHSKLFLPDLSNCVESVELVGLCFIQRHSDFLSMYSQYCQLLPASEALRKEIGENHPWFLACRTRLGHKLPLGAYLLKPVQRITKYHLLLKDLVKNSEGCEGFAELVEALECMLVVLRCVNDGMHQLGIVGYPGKLIEEGYLLLQGSFLMWTETRKDRLRLKGHQRHLFLYQRSILICKKVPKSSAYEFRSKLSLSEVGLTEALKGSGAAKKFEIWVNGRQKVFLFQAENQEIKELWVREVKKLLLEQLESLRATKAQTIAACGIGSASSVTSSIPSVIQPLAVARRQKMLSKGITVNGWRTSNMGHRALRQVSSWDNPDPIRPKSRTNNDCEVEDEFWSSEISNSDDDDSTAPPSRPLSIAEIAEDPVITNPSIYGASEDIENSSGSKYIALADYGAMGPAEVTLKEGDVVSLVKVGCGGWWFVKTGNSLTAAGSAEGWAPSAYLEKFNGMTKQSLSSCSSSSMETQPTRNIMLPQSIANKFALENQSILEFQGQGRSASIPGPTTSVASPLQSFDHHHLSQSSENILSALR